MTAQEVFEALDRRLIDRNEARRILDHLLAKACMPLLDSTDPDGTGGDAYQAGLKAILAQDVRQDG